jgi:hypothetical protein
MSARWCSACSSTPAKDSRSGAGAGWLVDVAGAYSALFVLTAIMSAAGALIFGLLFNERRIVDWPTSSSAQEARLSRAEVEPRRWRERRSAS